MTDIDIFNGDADGICALTQLRLAEPRDARLVTGVKRDINLMAQVEAQAKQITELRDGRKADQKELESVRMDLRATRDAMRDYEELLADYREHTYAYQVWTDDGGVPPSPTWSWRIAADQRDYAKQKGVG